MQLILSSGMIDLRNHNNQRYQREEILADGADPWLIIKEQQAKGENPCKLLSRGLNL